MPHNRLTSDPKKDKSRNRDDSSKDNDSTKTRRGSPVPESPDVSNSYGSSKGVRIDNYNSDEDLIGFGSQFGGK
ncbi:hypothetical protein F4804DRAFT_337230 [Jackrogersella minutella]|nr:hypothetical protein F4804DRAFT_337230 [Jackrogersella minutella]